MKVERSTRLSLESDLVGYGVRWRETERGMSGLMDEWIELHDFRAWQSLRGFMAVVWTVVCGAR